MKYDKAFGYKPEYIPHFSAISIFPFLLLQANPKYTWHKTSKCSTFHFPIQQTLTNRTAEKIDISTLRYTGDVSNWQTSNIFGQLEKMCYEYWTQDSNTSTQKNKKNKEKWQQ